ncbi:PEP-CTERM sorting domain-containing protein [Corallincola holothuriorum]|uniref:PEP-CTERM sorting domain-containing protein n=1 Tax=Corallincola holothuriorum TaxID=2282215 RepID=A0A368NQ23_9GAMM|nr:PEP-CTERM sorting domain-containing protein [Corallincola holothuriorum]RCU52642.1 PEP-CTERM sorting domain-containing protein [Corallincola holothuriorum]
MSVLLSTSIFTKKRLAVAIATTLLSANAFAAPIVSVKTTAGSQFTSDRSNDGVTTIDVVNSSTGGGYAEVTADPAGTYAIRLQSGWGWNSDFSETGASAKYSVRDSFTNNTGVNGIFDFNFTLDAGSAGVTTWFGGNDLDNLSSVDFSLHILINGVAAWGSEYYLAYEAGGVVFDQTGDTINTHSTWDGIAWDDQDITVDMGLVRAGETVDIEYYLKTEVNSGQAAGYDYAGPAHYNFGDPFDITGTPIFNEDAFVKSDRKPAQDVPAPASLLLLGLGAAGLAGNRRRKAKLK